MSRELPIILLIIFFFLGIDARSQVLLLHSKNQKDEVIIKKHIDVSRASGRPFHEQLTVAVSTLQQAGFFEVAILEKTLKKDTLTAILDVGPQYEWAQLHAGNLSPTIQEASGFRNQFFLQTPFYYQDIALLFDRVLTYAENHGYPFAQIQLANTRLVGKKVYADIQYQSGPLITFGRLQLNDQVKTQRNYLEAYLGMQPGNLYDERKIRQIAQKLGQLSFLSLTSDPQVSFQNETADAILQLKEGRQNSFDGIVNLLPSEGNNRKLLLTGELNIGLKNLWQSGKVFNLQWQRTQIESQRLNLEYLHPRVFHLPLDVSFNFNFLKEDTLYYNRQMAFSMAFPWEMQELSLTFSRQNSRLLEGNSILSENSAGELSSFDLNSLLLGYQVQHTNRVLFPTMGYSFKTGAGAGVKKLLPSIFLGEDTSWVTNSYKVTQFSLNGQAAYYKRMGSHTLLFHNVSSAALLGKELYLNDLYRLGGLKSLRGFYDNFFFASQYIMSNLELRLLFEQTEEAYSHLFLFYDQAFLKKETVSGITTDHPMGIGGGISLNTPAGVFNLVYAVGRSKLQSFNVQYSKIHFGYISTF